MSLSNDRLTRHYNHADILEEILIFALFIFFLLQTNPEFKVPKFPSPQTEVCLWVIEVTFQLLNGGGE